MNLSIKKKVLLELAAYFLNQVSGMWGGRPVCAELRDFINWISLYVPIKAPAPVKQMPDRKYPLDIVPAYRSKPDEISFDPVLVKKWARNFANRLSERKEGCLFCATVMISV